MTPKLGLSDEQRMGIINILNTVVADEHVLYTKLRNYHWNVTGAQFFALHELFEEQYNAVKEITDTIAERIRAHGGYAIGTLTEFLDHTRLDEQSNVVLDARGMVFNIVLDHEKMVRNLREDARICAQDYADVATEDLLVGLMQQHQEMAWMLRSFIEGEPVHPSATQQRDKKSTPDVQFSRN